MDGWLCRTLPSGQKLPNVGFSATSPGASVQVALQSGYRYILTGSDVQSTPAGGRDVARWLQSRSNNREQLFLSTQMAIGTTSNVSVRAQCLKCLYNLRCEYLDLMLLHKDAYSQISLVKDSSGKQQLVKAWQAIESLVNEGQIRSLGVQNFDSTEIEYLLSQCVTPPSILVVDWRSIRQERGRLFKLNNYCKYRKLQPVIALQTQDVLDSDDQWCSCVRHLATKYNRPAEQVGAKAIQLMNLPLVIEATTANEIQEAYKVFDWTLSPEDADLVQQSIYQ